MAAQPILPHDPRQGQENSPGGYVKLGVPCCQDAADTGISCGVRYASYVRVGRVPGLDCDEPLQLVFRCGASRVTVCDRRREDKCRPCSGRHKRYLIRRAESGCEVGGLCSLMTLTAPGESDHLRVDPKFDEKYANSLHPAARPGWRKKSAPRPACWCHRDGDPAGDAVPLDVWNASAGACWNRMLTQLRRRYPGVQFIKVVEVQKRGALHLHIMVRSSVVLDVVELQALALAAGFGCNLDVRPMSAAAAARYVAKYATKAYTARQSVPWRDAVLDKETGELVPRQTAAYRTVSQSKHWGLTLRQIKSEIRAKISRDRASFAAGAAALDPLPLAEAPALEPAPATSGAPPP